MEFWRSLDTLISAGSARENFFIHLGLAAGLVVMQVLFVRLTWILFRWLKEKITRYGSAHFRSLIIKKYRLLETAQILQGIFFLLNIAKYIVTAFLFFITVPLVFSLFPVTRHLAFTLFGYILTPLKTIGLGIIDYVPSLVTIIIILVIVNYFIRTLKFFAVRIEKGRLVIPGFYADWAQPTFNILRILLYAFTVALVYPYLPGSNSRVFQGVSVFVGIIISLGSSSAIGNLVAGIVLTYMRPFKPGDRIKINDITGFVVEKSPIVIRLRTHKNEYVTFPNMMVLNSSIVNYHTSTTENEEGLILYAGVSFGYGTPWQTVHNTLIEAALNTKDIQQSPRPFVLQTALDDFYCHYEINCYTKAVDRVPALYAELYENIQNGFHAQGIDMTAAHYRVHLPHEPSKPRAKRAAKPAGAGPKTF